MKLYRLDKQNLQFKKVPIYSWIIGYSLAVIFLTMLIRTENYNIEQIPVKIENKADAFSKGALKSKIASLNIQHQNIVFAQAILESSGFASDIFRQNNNLFGMKEAKQRPTTAMGTQLKHAVYKNWEHSVIDYGIWQSAYARNLSTEQYLDLLNSMYAEDDSYKEKLLSIMKYQERK